MDLEGLWGMGGESTNGMMCPWGRLGSQDSLYALPATFLLWKWGWKLWCWLAGGIRVKRLDGSKNHGCWLLSAYSAFGLVVYRHPSVVPTASLWGSFAIGSRRRRRVRVTCLRHHTAQVPFDSFFFFFFSSIFQSLWLLTTIYTGLGLESLDAEAEKPWVDSQALPNKKLLPCVFNLIMNQSHHWVLPTGVFCLVYPTLIKMWVKFFKSGSFTNLDFWLLLI